MATSPLTTALSKLRRPMGLAGRAVLFVTALLLLTAAMATMTVWYGVERESEQHQNIVARDLTTRFAETVASMVNDGYGDVLPSLLERMAARDDIRRLSLRDRQGRVIAEQGDNPEDVSVSTQLAGRVNASGRVEALRSAENWFAVGAPLVLNGRRIGVAVIIWPPNQFRLDALQALAPFFLFLGCFTLAAIPIAVHFVRKAIAPLDELTRFAENVAEQGEAPPLVLGTGDEFETLAGAFNQMIGRLDASARRIQEIAFIDPTTQLPNQDWFLRDVDFRLLQANAPTEAGAVFVLEFQRLARIMPTLDLAAARELIKLVAGRFIDAARTVDSALRPPTIGGEHAAATARLGALDFAVFAPGISSPTDAARFGQHLTAALNQPFDWRGHKFSLGASCGVALARREGKGADAIVRQARIALSAAQTAPTRMKVFTQSLDREAIARVTLEREMRGALERNEFRAYFQPKINLATGRIEGAEALARWVRPDRTIIGPQRFIPLAEESGLIGPLSDAIMREACWKAAAWARTGAPVKMAVNVSSLQFRDDRFAEHVLQIIRHAGLPPRSLELEITESVAMEDPDRALRLIEPLRAAGVRLAIDDFGCGHSSLAALSKLPFDVIKIDQQFVRALDRGEAQAEVIIELILALAGKLNLEIVAEGVERREHADFMAARGCHWVQGFLYGAAVSAADFAELLRKQASEELASAHAA